MKLFNDSNFLAYLILKFALFVFIVLALTVGFDIVYGLLYQFVGMQIHFKDFLLQPYFIF